MAANNQETTPSEISSTDSDTSGGVPLDSESKAEHELRTMKIKYLQLEADLIRGEGELGGVHSVQGTSDKLTELKFMVCFLFPFHL